MYARGCGVEMHVGVLTHVCGVLHKVVGTITKAFLATSMFTGAVVRTAANKSLK